MPCLTQSARDWFQCPNCSKMIRPVLSGVVAADPETMSVAYLWPIRLDVCRIFLFLIWYSENLLGSCGLRGLFTVLDPFCLSLLPLGGAAPADLHCFYFLPCAVSRFHSLRLSLCARCLWALGHLAIRKNEREF